MYRRIVVVALDNPFVLARLFLFDDVLQVVVQVIELDVLLLDIF